MSSLLKLPALLGQLLPESPRTFPPAPTAGAPLPDSHSRLQCWRVCACRGCTCQARQVRLPLSCLQPLLPGNVLARCGKKCFPLELTIVQPFSSRPGQDEQLTPCPHMVLEFPLMLFPLSRTPSSKFCLLKCPLFFKSCSRATSSQVSLGLLALPTSPPHPTPECVICSFV